MENNNSVILQKKFPQLPFSKTADDWLSSVKGKRLLEQLRDRRVTSTRIIPLLGNGGLDFDENGNFRIELCDMNTPQENASSLGHELGHTFHFDLTQTPPLDTLAGNHTEDIEYFCDAFADAWLAQNGREKVELCCKNQAGLIFQCDFEDSAE